MTVHFNRVNNKGKNGRVWMTFTRLMLDFCGSSCPMLQTSI